MKNTHAGNLDFGVTEDSIRSLLEQYGTVERVSLIRDRSFGQPPWPSRFTVQGKY
ncbi:MAG: RNA-binding protein [Bryobacteraceae bacterium]